MADREPQEDSSGGTSYLVIVVVIAAVVLVYWLASAFFDWNKTQECVGVGKRNCAPRIELNQQ
jgi:hypothetical protein